MGTDGSMCLNPNPNTNPNLNLNREPHLKPRFAFKSETPKTSS